MCALKILTNEDLCAPTDEDKRFGHLGTRDSIDPSVFYDYPGKTSALVKAAHDLAEEIRRGNMLLAPLPIEISRRLPTQKQLLWGHPQSYLTALEAASREARARAESGLDTIHSFGFHADVSAGTYHAALRSVGTAFDAVDHVMAHPTTTAFALVWPPGHHAEPTLAMGFCYLSTAALAALYARDHATRADSNRPNRVVLIDIDHHSGNGSAAILANQPEILFVDQLYRSPYDETLKRYTDGDYDSATDSYIGSGREFTYTKEDTTLDHRLPIERKAEA